MLGYEKFGAYQKSLQFFAFVLKVLETIPSGNGAVTEQFRSAALSVVLNIAEGSGKPSGRDRNRSYQIAKGSAMECGALLDICQLLNVLSPTDLAWGKGALEEIIGILSAVCRGKD